MVYKNKGTTIFQEYIELHNKYTKLYGDKTTVLMQVGGFFEIYCKHTEKENLGPKSEILIGILNIIFSKKNKDTPNYHYMAGWPTHSNDKYVDILLNNNYKERWWLRFKIIQGKLNGSTINRGMVSLL